MPYASLFVEPRGENKGHPVSLGLISVNHVTGWFPLIRGEAKRLFSLFIGLLIYTIVSRFNSRHLVLVRLQAQQSFCTRLGKVSCAFISQTLLCICR